MGEIKWTEKASSNLQSIFDYISRDSRLYATRYVKALILATKRLETMPQSGRIVPELENPELREVIYGNHRIVHRVVWRCSAQSKTKNRYDGICHSVMSQSIPSRYFGLWGFLWRSFLIGNCPKSLRNRAI